MPRDGLLYTQTKPGDRGDLWFLPMTGDKKASPTPFVTTRFTETFARFSPDGRWVAFRSDQTGQFEIHVASFANAENTVRVSTTGGTWPRWRRDGKELFYIDDAGKLVAAEVDGQGATFKVLRTQPLFTMRASGRSPYDVSADGQKFLVNATPEGEAALGPPITVVLNWPAVLKK